jgi:hypothetical protein
MKKEATPKRKGPKSKTSDEKRGNPKTQGPQIKVLQWKRGNPKMQGAQIKDLHWKKRQSQNARGPNQRPPMQKMKNYWTKASSAKLTLEGEGDAFRLSQLKNKKLLAYRSKLHQTNAWRRGWLFPTIPTQKSKTVSLPKLAPPNYRLKAREVLSDYPESKIENR